ncbi:helix-turn-helix domain-containing protein [Deinococcus peraridilitoris]|uniref:Helix-turn-helix domain-containing protein n=1 Tax=Deinococcus peraridilitoris (strain DSM 19664 / LMG 22246 / CIP 109416 / KR-200) TaxID=937777 RepID=L0A2F8_DEIPD|nr:helix-turn-helix domain-containing protein [Deinococcus peraridilitoris]AFZ67185.1 hypothetical protein Deipe_1652 [Deinococcus peraridilitoris DSM 19664]
MQNHDISQVSEAETYAWPELLVTRQQAARITKTSVSTIDRMIDRGELQVTYVGASPRILTASLLAIRVKPGKKQEPGK